MSIPIQEVFFHTDVAAPANGTELKTKQGTKVLIEIVAVGQGVAFAGKFQGKAFADGDYFDVACKNLTTGASDDDFIANGLYQFELNGVYAIRAKLDAVANGTVTIRGREIS